MCSSCGLPSEGSSCSMCYGDIDYGNDGYYRAWAEQQDTEQEDPNDETEETRENVNTYYDSDLPF